MEQFPDLELYYFVYKTCGANWRLVRNVHMANGMVIILRGEAHYRIDGRDYHVRAGDVVYTRPGMEREATTTGMLCAAFDFDLSKGCIDLPIISRHSGTEELERLIREYQYEWLGKAPGFKLKCAGIFLQLLHELQYGGETRANYHVEKIKRYIVDHYAKPIRVESIAAMSGLSTVYCGALFRRTQGMTIIQFANLIRVQRAASILEEEVYSIGEVAYMCGFSDVYYFSRTFKKIMGISPSRWGHLHPMTGIPKAT